MKVTVEMLGGLDQVFEFGTKIVDIDLPVGVEGTPLSLLILLMAIGNIIRNPNIAIKEHDTAYCSNLYRFIDREEFATTGEHRVAPGIMVLINDVDWELLEEENTQLQEHDIVTFTSTLHGG